MIVMLQRGVCLSSRWHVLRIVAISLHLFLLATIRNVSSFVLVPPLLARPQYSYKYKVSPRQQLHAIPPNDADDWRAFQAKLVGQSTFDAGAVIQKGSLVLSQVEDSLGCHDLNQPYLHKAVVLVLDHDPLEFTQGVVLNRPTDLILTDHDILYDGETVVENDDSGSHNHTDSTPNAWPVQFGGDLAGLFDDSRQAMILCLYKNETSNRNLSADIMDPVLADICVTSHAGASTLIQQGLANTTDFVTFYGYCGWEPGQLDRELARGSWTMVTTTADDIWEQLQNQQQSANTSDPRSAGLGMWEYFTKRIGQNATRGCNAFGDCMLKAWTTEYLCLARSDKDEQNGDTSYFTSDDNLQQALTAASSGATMVQAGMVFRAIEPFLLHEQYLHKAVVAVLAETEQASVGLVLNVPTTDTYTLATPGGKQVDFTIRYGGASGKDNARDEPLLWLHASRTLRQLNVGTPLSQDHDLPSKVNLCTVDDVMGAIDLGMALPREFLVIQGFCVWEKQLRGQAGGLCGQVLAGNWERVASSQVENVWTLLQSQDTLTKQSLDWNLQNSLSAWTIAGLGSNRTNEPHATSDDLIYDTNVSVKDLADVAFGVWMTIFLLGDAEYAPTSL